VSTTPAPTARDLARAAANPRTAPKTHRSEVTQRDSKQTRRHWFTGPVEHNTGGTVNVLNLVEGPAAIVESPSAGFEPFVIHHAETFVVPASVGSYRIGPLAGAERRLATVKAYVRES
jgi:hypothetical protein